MHSRYIINTLLVLLFLCLPSTVLAENETTKIIVKYNENSKYTLDLLNIAESAISSGEDLVTIEVPINEADGLLEKLNKNAAVTYAEQEMPLQLMNVPNDPFYQNQSKDFSFIKALEGWGLFSPQRKVRVAVIDSGIRLDHPDLRNVLINGKNFLDNSPPVDDVGHGTHVAGIIGAQTNNQVGVASLSKGMVELMPLKVLGQQNGRPVGTTLHLANAIRYAADNGVEVINLSVGLYEDLQHVSDAIQYAHQRNVLMIAAAGNDGAAVVAYPAAYDEVIAVAAVNSTNGSLASFSNYGQAVEVAAPGESVFSTFHANGKLYDNMSGTSMATPFVSSLAAMLKAHSPYLVHSQIRDIISRSATTVDVNRGIKVINAREALQAIEQRNRIYGANAIHTSLAIAQTGWGSGISQSSLGNQTGRYVVMATNQTFPDSLTGSTLAHRLQAPLILMQQNRIDSLTLQYLQEKRITDIVLLGGIQAISAAVEQELKQKGYRTVRVSGVNRFDTNVKINQLVAQNSDRVIVASGENFPDALSIAPFASRLGIPIVLVRKDTIPREVQEYLNRHNFSEAIVIGGEMVVSNNVFRQLRNPIRIAGANRYDTAIKINRYFNNTSTDLLVTSGENFRDALSGANLAAKNNMAMVLVGAKNFSAPTKSFVQDKVNRGEQLTFTVLGGPVAVNREVVWEIDRIINESRY